MNAAVPPGEYVLVEYRRGQVIDRTPVTVPGDAVRSAAAASDTPIDRVSAVAARGDRYDGGDISYPRSATVDIWVTASNGSYPTYRPVADANVTVTVTRPDGTQETFEVNTGNDGVTVFEYSLDGKPSGRYQVDVSPNESTDGYVDSGRAEFRVGGMVHFLPDLARQSSLGEPVNMSIRVLEGYEPMARYQQRVRIERPDGTSETVDLITGTDGFADFSFTPTQEGRYRIVAVGQSSQSKVIRVGDTLAKVSINGERSYGEAFPGEQFTFSGPIRADGQPYANRQIVAAIYDRSDQTYVRNIPTTTTSRGLFQVTWNVPSDVEPYSNYELRLFTADGDRIYTNDPYLSIERPADSGGSSGGPSLSVQSDGFREVPNTDIYTNAIAPGNSDVFRATLRDADGNPVANERVQLAVGYDYDFITEVMTARTNDRGIAEFTVSIPENAPHPTDFEVRATAQYGGEQLQAGDYRTVRQHAWEGDFSDYEIATGQSVDYTLTGVNLTTRGPATDQPVTVGFEAEGLDSDAIAHDAARTGADGQVTTTVRTPGRSVGYQLTAVDTAPGIELNLYDIDFVEPFVIELDGLGGEQRVIDAGETAEFNFTDELPETTTGVVTIGAEDSRSSVNQRILYAGSLTEGQTASVQIPSRTVDDTWYSIQVIAATDDGRVAYEIGQFRVNSSLTDPEEGTLTVPGDYDTIQAAVDAADAGDRIEVAPGTYREQVTLNESVTLVAPDGATLDGSGLSGSETTGLDIATDAVPSIRGFTITGYDTGISATGTNGAWTATDIRIPEAGVGVSALRSSGNWEIRDAEISHTAVGVVGTSNGDWVIADSLFVDNDFGVRAVDSQGDWTIRNTRISGGEAAVNAEQSGGNWTVSNATISDADYDGIFAPRSHGDWTVRDSTIRRTNFSGVYAVGASGDWAIRETRIRGANLSGVLAAETSGNWRIENSTLTRNGDPSVGHNDPPTFAFSGVVALDTNGAWTVTNSTIANNAEYGLYAENTTVTGDADRNYWGAPDGPSGDFPGSGAAVAGDVSVEPFYADPALTTLETFDDGSNESADLVVDKTDPNAYDSVQAAVDAAAPGDTIAVAPGVYNESVGIDTAVTLTGRPSEPGTPVLDGEGTRTAGVTIAAGTSHVTVEGFDIRGYTDGVQSRSGGTTNVTIRQNTIHDVSEFGIATDGNEATNPHRNWVVRNNTIENVGWTAVLLYSVEAVTVSNNRISPGQSIQTGYGIAVGEDGPIVSDQATIRGNHLSGQFSQTAITVWTAGGAQYTDVLIENNTVDSGSRGIWLSSINESVTTTGETTTANAQATEQARPPLPTDSTTDANSTVTTTAVSTARTSVDRITVRNNSVTGTTTAGVVLRTSGPVTISSVSLIDNRIENNARGVNVVQSGGTYRSIDVRSNVIVNNAPSGGVSVGSGVPAGELELTRNVIVGNGATGVTSDGDGVLSATRNYWGAPDGPSGDFSGSGDAVVGDVDVLPYYVDRELTTLSSAVGPNFTVTAFDVPVSVKAGDTVTVEATINNTGDRSGTQTVEFYLDNRSNDGFDPGDRVASRQLTLGPGENRTIEMTYSTDNGVVPNVVAFGTAVVTDDDRATRTIDVTAPPTAAVTFDDRQVRDGTSTVMVNRTNFTGGPYYVVVYREQSPDDGQRNLSSPIGRSRRLADGPHEGVAVDLGRELSNSDTVDAVTEGMTLVAGLHYARDTGDFGRPIVRDGHLVADAAQVTVPPDEPPNFRITRLGVEEPVGVGDTTPVTVTIRNEGGPARLPVDLRLDTSGDTVLSAGETQTSRAVRVGAGETRTVTFSLGTNALDPGTHAAGVVTPNGSRQSRFAVTPNIDVPEPPGGGGDGSGTGDPHLTTFDGVSYDFQAAGEFVLARAPRGDLNIQSRLVPVGGGRSVSVISAVATSVDGHNVTIDARDETPVSVDGVNRSLNVSDRLAVGNGTVYRQGTSYIVVFPGDDGQVDDGDEQLRAHVRGSRIDAEVVLDQGRTPPVEGLLGSPDGNTSNDLVLADGTTLAKPLSYEVLYGPYREDYRVNASTSLFDYDGSESPETFYDETFPRDIVTVGDLGEAERQRAADRAREAGLEPGTPEFEDAVLDFALTGDSSYVGTARRAANETKATEDATPPASVRLDPRSVANGSTVVTVDRASFTAGPYYLTVHRELTPDDGVRNITAPVGVSSRLTEGTHTDVTVELGASLSAADDLDALSSNETLVAVIRRADLRNETFADEVTTSGGLVADGATVTITPNRPPTVQASLASPVNNVESPVRVTVTATDPDGTVDTIELRGAAGTDSRTCQQSSCTVTLSVMPQDPTWNGSGYVTRRFTVRATDDDDGATGTTLSTELYIAGDATGDGSVNIFDAVAVGQNWQTQRGTAGYSDAADLTNDGVVNIFDAVVIGRNWNRTASANALRTSRAWPTPVARDRGR